MMNDPLYIPNLIDQAGGPTEVARLMGLHAAVVKGKTVWAWKRRARIPAPQCHALVAALASKGIKTSCQRLRPDVFGQERGRQRVRPESVTAPI